MRLGREEGGEEENIDCLFVFTALEIRGGEVSAGLAD